MELFSSLSDFIEYDFLFYSLIGTTILAITCGLVSPLVIAKKYAFMGAAVSHSALLGVAIGLSLVSATSSLALFGITLSVTLILVSFLAFASFRQKLPSDSLIGVFFSTTMGLGILIYSMSKNGNADLLSYLFGNILLLTKIDLVIAFIVLGVTIPLILIPINKWLYITFDEEAALVSGVKVSLFHFGFYLLITLIVVSSVKIAGTVLVNTLLLIPGIVGLKFGKSVFQTFKLSVLFSLSTALFGLYLANLLNTPSGATLAVTQFAVLLIFLFAKKLLK